MDAYILINSMPSQEKNIIEDLNKISKVIEVNGILGKYDIIVKISSDLPNDIDLAVEKIRSIKGITSSDTMPVIYGQGGSIDNEINKS